MLSTRFVVAPLILLTACPHLAWSRLAAVPSSSRVLEAGTCANNGVACDTTSEVTDCKGCSTDGASCNTNSDCLSFKGCLDRNDNYNGKTCPNGNECKGQSTCADITATCIDGAQGSCQTGGGGGNGLCSDGTTSCSVDADCPNKCAGGNNDGSLCSEANCNKGGGSCGIETCNTGGPSPTPPPTPPPVTSGGCGSNVSKTVEIINGSTQDKYNGEYFDFAGTIFSLLQANAVVDILQSNAYNHPFRLCAGGLYASDDCTTVGCALCQVGARTCGTTCVDNISDTNSNNPCNPDVTLPSSTKGLWYVCTVSGHQMFNEIY